MYLRCGLLALDEWCVSIGVSLSLPKLNINMCLDNGCYTQEMSFSFLHQQWIAQIQNTRFTTILFYFSSFTCIKIPYLFRKSVEFKICSTCINDFIQNVLYWMLLLLEVEQDSKDVYKKLQCQQKIYISRKSSKSRRHLLHSYIFFFLDYVPLQ